MAIVIAILNSKGGAGKTVLATNVAGCLHKRNHRVLIVDSDPQGSARDWYVAQPDTANLPAVMGVDRPVLHKSIPALGDAYEYVIIDGAARLEEITASAIKAADFVLIPVRHSGLDMWAVESLVESIKAWQEFTGGKPKAAFVISCQTRGSRLAKSVDGALSGFGLPIMKSRTTHRVAYAEAGGFGLTVLDLKGRKRAADEIKTITNELVRMLHHDTV